MPTMFKTATAALLIAVAPVAAFAGNTPVTPDPTQGTSNLGASFILLQPAIELAIALGLSTEAATLLSFESTLAERSLAVSTILGVLASAPLPALSVSELNTVAGVLQTLIPDLAAAGISTETAESLLERILAAIAAA